jgi:CheY-like chemotaxis protein
VANILVIDDDDALRAVMRRTLERGAAAGEESFGPDV